MSALQELREVCKRVWILRRVVWCFRFCKTATRFYFYLPLVVFFRAYVQMRVDRKKWRGEQIRVVFLLTSPQFWGALEGVYRRLINDSAFHVEVVALPREKVILTGMTAHEFFDSIGVAHRLAYTEASDTWLDLKTLHPDYVFMARPYNHVYPPSYRTYVITRYALLCYSPYYGMELLKGPAQQTVHPRFELNHMRWIFVGESERSPMEKVLCNRKNLAVVGFPKMDYIFNPPENGIWRRSRESTRLRILWTPRWTMNEGFCTFLDYKDFFLAYVEANSDVEFVFRPHPGFSKEFDQNGLFDYQAQARLREHVQSMSNFQIDDSPSYSGTFMTADVLISDASSMLAEYLATRKPLIYTHKSGEYLDFSRKFMETCVYRVDNQRELEMVLSDLMNGVDPLKTVRDQLIGELFNIGDVPVSEKIRLILKE